MLRSPFPKERALTDFNGKELEVGDQVIAVVPDPTHRDNDLDGRFGVVKHIYIKDGDYYADVEFDRSFTCLMLGYYVLFHAKLKNRNRQSTRGHWN